VILGIINLGRLIAERIAAGPGANETYYYVLGMDILISALAIAGGWGLIKGRRWAPATVLCLAGGWFISSVVLFFWIWPYFVEALEMQSRSGTDIILGPRLFFYGFVFLACPYAAFLLFHRREAGWPSRRRLAAWMAGGMVVCGGYVAVLIARH